MASEAIESRTLLSGFSIKQSVIAAPDLQRIRALDVAYFSDGSVAVVDGYEYFSDSSGVSEDQAGVWRLTADGEPLEGFGDSGFVLQPGDEVFSRYQGSGRVERYDPVLNSVAVGPGDELIVGATHRHEQATINNTATSTGSLLLTFDASGQYDIAAITGHSYVNIEPPDRWPYYVAQLKRISDIGFTTEGKRIATGGASWFASSPYYEGSPKWVENALFTESLATPTNAPALRVPQRGEILRSQLTELPDGSIVTLSGAVSDDGHIAEFTANGIDIYADDGELSGTYSVGIGEEATPLSVEWQSDGKLLLLYSENDDLLLQRYNTDGSIDYSLHGTGALKLYDAVVSGATGLNSLPDGSVQATATTADGDLIHFNLTPKQIHAPFDVSGQAATIEWSATGDYHVVWLSNIDTKQRVGYWVTDQTSLTTHYLPQGRYRVWVQPVRPLSETPSDNPRDYTSTGPWSEGHEFRAVRASVDTYFLGNHRLQRTAAPSAPKFSWFPLEVYSREKIVYDLQVVPEGSDTPVVRQESIEGRVFWSQTSLLSGRYDVWLQPKVRTAAGEAPIGGWERSTLEIKPSPEPLIDDFSSVSPIANPAPELTWSASPGEPLYELKVNDVDSGATVLHRHRLATSSYVPEVPFAPGTYEMQVRDHTSTGVSEWRRQEFSIIAPSSGHVALVENPRQSPDVTLVWTDNSAVQSWIVTLDEDNDELDRGEGGVTANHYRFSDVAAGRYKASVWSVNGEGDHRLLGYVDVVIPESATRPHIHGIIDESAVGTGGRTLAPRPKLSWTRTTDATSYSFWLQDISRKRVVRRGTVSRSSFTPDSDLLPGEYKFWVQPLRDGEPLHGWSDEFSFTVIASDVAEISPVRSLQPGDALTWPSIEGADAYEVFVSDITNGVYRFEYMKGLATNSIMIPEAWSEGLYRIWVRGEAAGKPTTTWSDPLVIEVRRRQVVQFESPGEGETLFEGEVDWRWTPVEGAINYRVQWSDGRQRAGIISEPVFDQQTAEITVYPVFPGDVFGQPVTRRINYYDHKRVSFVSPATGDRISGDSVTITWDGPSSGWRSSYEIWVSNLTTGDVIRWDFINELSFEIPHLPTATGEYRYRVWLKVYDIAIDWLPETLDFTYVVE